MGKLLKRNEILDIQDIKTERVEVPEWGGDVLVRGLDGSGRDGFEASVLEQHGKKRQVNLQDIRAKLVAKSCVDEDGNLIFSEDDVAALTRKSAAALQRVYQVAQRLCGLSDEDVDELQKNSVSAPAGASTSD
jgi:hypothetical protein